jgi:hypothetical protein
MNWLSDIIKNLEISKTLVVAIFVTATVMYFGPIHAPAHVPAMEQRFAPYVFAAMALTGCLLALWLTDGASRIFRAGVHMIAIAFMRSSLMDSERAILLVLAKDPTQALDLANIDYTTAPGSKLEFHQLAKGLVSKGLVSINDWDHNLISLTEKGRENALEIQRQAKPASAV